MNSKKESNSNLQKLMGYAGRYRVLTYMSLVLSAASAVIALLPFIYLWRIFKSVFESAPNFSEAEGIVQYGWLAVLTAIIGVVVYIAALICSHLAAFRIASNIKLRLLSHIRKLPIGAVSHLGSGKLRKIISESASSTETYLAHQLPDMIGAVVTPIALLVMLFIFDVRLGIVSLIPVVIAFVSMMGMVGKGMAEDMRQYQNALEDMNNEAVEYVRGMPVVKTFGQSVFTFKRFRDSIANYGKFCISYTKRCRKSMVSFEVAANSVFAFLVCTALIIAKGGLGAISSEFFADLMFYIIITPIISTTLTKIIFMSDSKVVVADALSRVDSVFEFEPLLEKENGESIGISDYTVRFENVSYRYDGAIADAVSELSFEVPQGSHVALVGPSGGGKSTAAALLDRFFDPYGGRITIGGVDIKNISRSERSRLIAYVNQDNRLLKTTIEENLRLAKQNATEEEMENALSAAQCSDIIEKLPNGIKTVIGSKGTYLSGGEMQRIAIARAILKDSPIVILDEATAFADPENEALVQKAFSEIGKNKTVIMIAHRLSSVKNADRIFVLRNGGIAEHGTHEELLNAGSDGSGYAHMWEEYQKSVSWKVGQSV